LTKGSGNCSTGKWEWDLCFSWEWEWDENGNEVTELGGIWYENVFPHISI